MPEAADLPQKELIGRKLEEFQKRYFDTVDIHFREGNRPRGDAAFSGWETRFREFLADELPGLGGTYDEHISRNSGARLAMLTVHQNWKRAGGEAVESFLAQAMEDARSGNLDRYISRRNVPPMPAGSGHFVDGERIRQLQRISSDTFDLARLVRLCEELNICHSSGALYAIAMLTRSILDHVPPVFGCSTFKSPPATQAPSRSKTRWDTSSKHLARYPTQPCIFK